MFFDLSVLQLLGVRRFVVSPSNLARFSTNITAIVPILLDNTKYTYVLLRCDEDFFVWLVVVAAPVPKYALAW